VDCADKEGKKLCKKLKVAVPQTTGYELKHYKDGTFNKDYDRKFSVQSIATFMKDPSAGICKRLQNYGRFSPCNC
jgi:hypothetical protein